MRSTLKTVALTAALCFCFAGSSALLAQEATASNGSAAQDGQYGGHRGPMSPDDELSRLSKKLNLSSDQQSQIKPILQDRHDQLMQIHQDASLSREAKGSKMKSLDDDSNTKLEAVLNGQQKTTYEKMVADQKARREQMRSRHMNGGDGADAGAQPQ